MAITHRIGGVLLALALSPMGTACTATPVPTPTVNLTPSQSPTAATLSPAEQDLENAKHAVVQLWEVVDRLTNNPKSSIQDLDAVASGQVLTMLQENLMTYRAQRWTGSGSAIVTPESAKGAGTNARGYATWTVTACVDRSHTTLIDTKGKSAQLPPYRIRHRSNVVQRSTSLYVEQDEALGTC